MTEPYKRPSLKIRNARRNYWRDFGQHGGYGVEDGVLYLNGRKVIPEFDEDADGDRAYDRFRHHFNHDDA